MNNCWARAVNDVDVDLTLAWLGNGTLDIGVSVQNNDTIDYVGYLRVYVTQTVSTRGWNGTDGKPYTHTLLDYAFDESVFVEAGGIWQDDTTWYQYAYRNITPNNITVVAAVFDTVWHQGYSDPPSGSPFNAYYVDDATDIWLNYAPYVPSDPMPEDSQIIVNPNSEISWTGGDPNYFDNFTPNYEVYFDTTNPPSLVSSQSSTHYDPELGFGKTYYWQIVSSDQDSSVSGPVWSFTTIARGDCDAQGDVNISDAIFMINYLFKFGPTPDPIEAADTDCDGSPTVGDVIYLINFLFKGGPPPAC